MVVGGGDPGGEEGRRGRARHAAAMLSSPAKNVSCEQHVEFGAQPGGVGLRLVVVVVGRGGAGEERRGRTREVRWEVKGRGAAGSRPRKTLL